MTQTQKDEWVEFGEQEDQEEEIEEGDPDFPREDHFYSVATEEEMWERPLPKRMCGVNEHESCDSCQ